MDSTTEDKLMAVRWEVGGGWVKQAMGIKECTRWDGHWVLYRSVESLYPTPESVMLCVNYTGINLFLIKQRRRGGQILHLCLLSLGVES